jgi:hypothetical protein
MYTRPRLTFSRYFILWLKEYAVRYNRWASTARPPKPTEQFSSAEHYRFFTEALPSTQLARFYLRAKQTFLTPGTEFELNVPSEVLSPFHTGHFVSPHPDPIVFAELAWEVHRMLKESLDRFVIAQYNNVGTGRAVCGMIGGTVIALAGSVAPMVVNFMHGYARWLRLLALPGLWLGLTVLISSLHGVGNIFNFSVLSIGTSNRSRVQVCMMVYVFGDLRQLHKFELSRPQISPPRPLGFDERPQVDTTAPVAYKGADSSASVLPPYAFVRPSNNNPTYPLHRPTPTPLVIPERAHVHERSREISPSSSTGTPYDRSSHASANSSLSIATSDASLAEITMSPAYYEETPAPEGPNTRTGPIVAQTLKSDWRPNEHTAECNIHRIHGTAGFIRAFEEDPLDPEAGMHGDDTAFDFDALPMVADDVLCTCRAEQQRAPAIASSIALPSPVQDDGVSERRGAASSAGLFGHARYRAEPPLEPPTERFESRPHCQRGKPDVVVERQVAWMRAVPAFGPLTKILSPVVSRAQWEIVVKSAAIAGIVSLSVVFGLVAVPVMWPVV